MPDSVRVIRVRGHPDRILRPPTTVVRVVQTARQGRPGRDGTDGKNGRDGAPGVSGASFVFVQSEPARVWTVSHNLGRYPSVVTVDSANTTVHGGIRYPDENTVEVSFGSPFSGRVFCN